jgi:hypothetical protein
MEPIVKGFIDYLANNDFIVNRPEEPLPFPFVAYMVPNPNSQTEPRTQKIYISLEKQDCFGHDAISIFGIAYIGSDSPDPEVYWRLSKGTSNTKGHWGWFQTDDDTFIVGYGVLVPITDKLSIELINEAFQEIALKSDFGEYHLNHGADNF